MENILSLAIPEFKPGFTEFACGPITVAVCAWASRPGSKPSYFPTAVQEWAFAEYAKVNGSSGAGNSMGSNIPDMERFFADTHIGNVPNQLHYWEMQAVNYETIKAALLRQYPVIVTVTEASVYDLDQHGNPYWWGAAGSHIFSIVGLDAGGNFLVYDSAAVVRGDGNLQTPKTPLPWPRRYDPGKLVYPGYGTPVQMPWLAPIPSNNPLTWPKAIVANDYKLLAAETIWGAVAPGLRFDSGIAKWWLNDYNNGKFHGPPVSPERPYQDWQGKPGVIQVFTGGIVDWFNGIATFHPNG